MKNYFIIVLFLTIAIPSSATPNKAINHNHGTRSHSHPLPASGVNHSHNQKKSYLQEMKNNQRAAKNAYQQAIRNTQLLLDKANSRKKENHQKPQVHNTVKNIKPFIPQATSVAPRSNTRIAHLMTESGCNTEYKTNAKVCIEIRNKKINCNKSLMDENYFGDCDVILDYIITTDYEGGASLGTDIECNTEIEYKGREMYVTNSNSASNTKTHILYANGSEHNSMNFHFSFLSFNKIFKAKINSIECKVNYINLW